MDSGDDVQFPDWQEETFLMKMDYDLDYAIAMSLQDEFTEELKENKNEETFLKKMDDDNDYAIAMSLQAEFSEELGENKNVNLDKCETSKPLSIVDEQWELIDPHPDVHALFMEYDIKFFYGKLKSVEVRWSPRMTLCAGVCCYERGGFCSVRLSLPLLKLRPRRDLIETLLHEMIHAYLFVTHNNKDRSGHGPEFLSHMHRINKESGTRISVFHTFHDEVNLYQQHWWKCDGPCKNRRPFFGLVKRAMNRAPGPNDNWWAAHQASCGGKFIKIKEPDNYSKKKTTKRKLLSDSENKACHLSHPDIRNFLNENTSICNSRESSDSKAVTAKSSFVNSVISVKDKLVTTNFTETPQKKKIVPFQCTGHKLGTSSETSQLSLYFPPKNLPGLHFAHEGDLPSSSSKKVMPHSKIIKTSSLGDAKNELKDHTSIFVSTTPTNTTKKLIQSPIKKFLSPRIAADCSDSLQKKNKHLDVNEDAPQKCILKVPCPVCSIAVKNDEINSHLDKCLLNS